MHKKQLLFKYRFCCVKTFWGLSKVKNHIKKFCKENMVTNLSMVFSFYICHFLWFPSNSHFHQTFQFPQNLFQKIAFIPLCCIFGGWCHFEQFLDVKTFQSPWNVALSCLLLWVLPVVFCALNPPPNIFVSILQSRYYTQKISICNQWNTISSSTVWFFSLLFHQK